MIWTNNYGLPDSVAKALTPREYPPRADSISVTGLLQSPLRRRLQSLYDGVLVGDVADNVWMVFGTAVHKVLAEAAPEGSLVEHKLSMEIDGIRLVGVLDLLEPDGTLTDHKTTSVWSFVLGDKADWEAQVNLYALLARTNGLHVAQAQITAFLKDWESKKAKFEGDYPKRPVYVNPIPLWPHAQALEFARERIALHRQAVDADPATIPECTPEERWARPDKWAVKRRGAARALRVFDTEAEAELYQSRTPGTQIEHRAGENVRCANAAFCRVAEFCPWWRAHAPEGTFPEELVTCGQ